MVKRLPAVQETQVRSLGWEDPLEKEMAEKRKEVKGKGKKERYTHLNAEFQIIARRDKKVFLSGQCKERGKQ